MINKKYIYLILFCIALVYYGFRINVHTWETYYYTGCLDSFIHVQDMKPPTLKLSLPYEKLICLHYTQHPILYCVTYMICKYFFALKDGLVIVQLLNILSGIVGCFISYQVCLSLSQSRLLSVCLMLIVAFSDIYWYQCLSGEVYIQPFVFLVLSYYFLVNPEIFENERSNCKQVVYTSFAAGCAMSFHMFSALFYIVILYYLFELKKKNTNFKLQFMTGISVFIMTIFFCFTYVIPYVIIFEPNTISDWFQIVFLHTHNRGIWHVPLKFVIFETIWSFFIGTKHLLHAFVSGFSLFAIITRLIILFICCYSVWNFIFRDKEKKIEKKILLVWFITYFFFITINVPMVNDYWCFLIFPMVLFVILVLQQHIKMNYLIYALVLAICLMMSINFIDDIFPKNKIRQEDFFILTKEEKSIENINHIVMLGNKSLLSELWYIHQKYERKKVYYHAPDLQFKSNNDFLESFKSLAARIDENNFLLILDGTSRDVVRSSRLIKKLGIKFEKLFNISREYQVNELKTSIGITENPIMITLYGFRLTKS